MLWSCLRYVVLAWLVNIVICYVDSGIVLGCKYYVKTITRGSIASLDGEVQEGDFIKKVILG